MSHKKKLIEVALPLEAINVACKVDKDRKTGTIRNLHKWFAPMPSPAWRALIPAAILDDPGDEKERMNLLALLEKLVASGTEPAHPRLVKELHDHLTAQGVEPPVVFDPFCGGGSTLVEAQHLGLRAVGSDLNPIPVLITRILTAYLPKIAGRAPIVGSESERLAPIAGSLEGFVDDVSHYAKRVYAEAKNRIGRYYPPGPNGDPTIAWWWARTIRSPDPRFQGAMTPLVNGWWLSKRKGKSAFVNPVVDQAARRIRFEIVEEDREPAAPSKARCLYSGAPIGFPYIKEEGTAGRLGNVLLATITHGRKGRNHFPPREEDESLASSAIPNDPPNIDLPPAALGFTVQQYGIRQWSQLFTNRQTLALETFCSIVAGVPGWIREDGGDEGYAEAISSFLGLCVGKLAQTSSTQVRLFIDSRNGSAKAQPAFSRPDISPLWDYVEVNPFGGSVGDWLQGVETALRATQFVATDGPPARVEQRDARFAADLVSPGTALVATDPPYFSNFGYSDPGNYFYIWLRRALGNIHPDLFSTITGPASNELISDPTRHGGDKDAAKDYFTEGLQAAFQGLSIASRSDLPLLIIYAFKQQETERDGVVSTGWEAVLEALIRAGLSIVGTWPIHGTGSARARGLSSNALATYVLMVCRPRPVDAPVTTLGDCRVHLKNRMTEAVANLRAASIAPVDLAQAAVGPGMEVFSGYARVLQADGSDMTVRDALVMISAVLDEILEEQEVDFDRDTRWAITWFGQYGTGIGAYGAADSLARAKNTSVDGLKKAGIVLAQAGEVRLKAGSELTPGWDPGSDQRPTIWEATQHLASLLADQGESGAAALLKRLGAVGESARELAYRLHAISDKKNWSEEARRYNSLVVAWPEISRLAAEAPGDVQETLLGE